MAAVVWVWVLIDGTGVPGTRLGSDPDKIIVGYGSGIVLAGSGVEGSLQAFLLNDIQHPTIVGDRMIPHPDSDLLADILSQLIK